MRIGKIGVAVIGLVPFNVYGECTPTPDCASIGYTETSCEGDYLACPFDSTKLKCIPCDSSFRYDCSGDNITGGTGSACGGKYASCECSSTDYVFNNGKCFCSDITISDCLIGAIYYPDGKCSNDYVACRNPVGVVVKDNALVMSWRNSKNLTWGNYGTDLEGLVNMSVSAAQTDYDGFKNTSVIVDKFGEAAVSYAGVYCYNYYPIGMEYTKGLWYLPAVGELYDYVYGNYDVLLDIYTSYLGEETFDYYFYSSNEGGATAAYKVYAVDGSISVESKYHSKSVSCFLVI